MHAIDPSKYRHFVVRGRLDVDGGIEFFEPCHADDLPAGDPGKDKIAERVRRARAAQHGDPAARWSWVEVTEFAPPTAMIQGDPGERLL